MWIYPGVNEFKEYFTRDFPYGTDPDTSILDTDITKAIADATASSNQELFTSQASFNVGFLNLAAHYLVMSIQSSSQGISGQFTWNTGSRGVGSVSESVQIPARILENPEFAWLTKTNYGAKYLMLVLPLISGQMFTICGSTRP